MKCDALARELRLIARRGGGFGSETEAAILQLAQLLDENGAKSIEQLAAKLRPRPKSPPKQIVPDQPPEELVADFVDRLKGSTSAGAGLEVLQELARRGRASVPQVKDIARRFLGANVKFTSKTAAIAAIKDRVERKEWDHRVLQSIAERAKA